MQSVGGMIPRDHNRHALCLRHCYFNGPPSALGESALIRTCYSWLMVPRGSGSHRIVSQDTRKVQEGTRGR